MRSRLYSLEVCSCEKCPHIRLSGGERGGRLSRYCGQTRKTVTKNTDIPLWCPLPEAPQPIRTCNRCGHYSFMKDLCDIKGKMDFSAHIPGCEEDFVLTEAFLEYTCPHCARDQQVASLRGVCMFCGKEIPKKKRNK